MYLCQNVPTCILLWSMAQLNHHSYNLVMEASAYVDLDGPLNHYHNVATWCLCLIIVCSWEYSTEYYIHISVHWRMETQHCLFKMSKKVKKLDTIIRDKYISHFCDNAPRNGRKRHGSWTLTLSSFPFTMVKTSRLKFKTPMKQSCNGEGTMTLGTYVVGQWHLSPISSMRFCFIYCIIVDIYFSNLSMSRAA